jgi:enoyl-CoA hydratase/carnithine racemase
MMHGAGIAGGVGMYVAGDAIVVLSSLRFSVREDELRVSRG